MPNNNLKLKNLICLLSSGIIIAFGTFNLSKVYAQTVIPLTVSPSRQEIFINPGEQVSIEVSFYNRASSPIPGILKVADFIVDNNQGSPRIIDNISQASPRFAASNWFILPYDRMTIAADGKVSVISRIRVPADAHPGGRYVAVYFEPGGSVPTSVGGAEGAASGVASRLASLIYIRVAGPISEKSLISRFFTPFFYENGPIKVDTDILNRGDYHIRPKGVFTLTNMFGGLAAQDKLQEENIFPDTSRSYANTFGEKWMFGRYRIDLAASYGDQGKALSRFIYVWVFPWKVAVIIILTLIILILIGRNMYDRVIKKEAHLEEELIQEKEEIEELREQLKKRKD